jgi:hypothetical protein
MPHDDIELHSLSEHSGTVMVYQNLVFAYLTADAMQLWTKLNPVPGNSRTRVFRVVIRIIIPYKDVYMFCPSVRHAIAMHYIKKCNWQCFHF